MEQRVTTNILNLLSCLYGESSARSIAKLDRLLEKYSHMRRRVRRPGNTRLAERDGLLITYPYQVREPGTAPLRTLKEFLNQRAVNLISGVHLLPFYPYSSDDGFSVIDYLSVNPE